MTTTINASNSGSGGLIQTADASGILALQTAGTTAVTVDASQNVGIGTTSPAAPLHVGPTGTGAINGYTKFIVNSTDYAVTTLKSPAANFSQIIFTDPTSTNLGGINFFNSSYATPNAMAFLTGGGNERLRIDANGNVGIGTSSPTQTLMLGSGYIQTGQGVGGGGGVRFPYSSDASGRTWRARSDITGYGDFGLEQSTSQTGDTYATRLLITQAGVLQFNSGYGSAATAYGCRAWCQYNQSPSIIGAGNITSITVIGTGDVRLNFATAMVDSNYSAVATTNESGGQPKFCNSTQPSTTDIRIVTFNSNGSTGSFEYNSVAVFR